MRSAKKRSFVHRKPLNISEPPADYCEEWIILESQYITRWFVLGITGLVFSLGLGLGVLGLSLVSGEFEVTDSSLVRKQEMTRHGKLYGPTGRMVDYFGTNGFLYDNENNRIGYFCDVGVCSSRGSPNARTPVYYSCIWKAAIYQKDSKIFDAIAVASIALLTIASTFAYFNRKYIILEPQKSRYRQTAHDRGLR